MKSLKRNDVRYSNSSGEEKNDSLSVSIKDREWNDCLKLCKPVHYLNSDICDILVNEVVTQKLEEYNLEHAHLKTWYMENRRSNTLKHDTDRFTERMKRYTQLREAIEKMRDKARKIEELSIMDSTLINWENTVASIERKYPQLQQPKDIWAKFWDIVCRPRLLHDSIALKEANILKRNLKELRITDTTLESDIDVNKICQKFQIQNDFKHRQKKWIENQIGRFISEIRISSRKDLIDKLSDKTSGIVPFQIIEKCKPFCEQLSSNSYHEAKALYNIIQERATKPEQGNAHYSRLEDAVIILSKKNMESKNEEFCLKARTKDSIQARYDKLVERKIIDSYEEKQSLWANYEDKKILNILKSKPNICVTYEDKKEYYRKLAESQKKFFPDKEVQQIEDRCLFLDYHRYHDLKRTNDEKNHSIDDDVINKVGEFDLNKFRNLIHGTQLHKKTSKVELLTELKNYCQSYFIRPGRSKSKYRNPSCSLLSKESRQAALLLARYLKFLEVDACEFIRNYDKVEGTVIKIFSSNPKLDTYVPNAQIQHLVNILRDGQYVEEDPSLDLSSSRRRALKIYEDPRLKIYKPVLPSGNFEDQAENSAEQNKDSKEKTDGILARCDKRTFRHWSEDFPSTKTKQSTEHCHHTEKFSDNSLFQALNLGYEAESLFHRNRNTAEEANLPLEQNKDPNQRTYNILGRCDKRKDKELTKEPPSKKLKQLTENYEDMEKFSDNLFFPLSKPVHGANNPFDRNTSTAQPAKILNNIEKNVTEKDKTPEPININPRSDTVKGNVIDGVKNDHISKKKNEIPSKEPWQNIYHPPSVPTLLLERSLHYSRKYLTEQLNAKDGLGISEDYLSITQQIESKERQSDETGNSLTSKSASHPSRHAQSFSLLVRRMESLLFWPIRMGKLGPPLELKNAAETLTEESSQYKPGVRNGVYRNSTRLSKTQLSQMRRANMLKSCHGVDDLKTVEPHVKRKYVKKPKEEKKTEIRRSSQRNKT
ncbi:hypothetical protein QYM36_008087 [Artemia franciscana]|uniref:Uncharacterized protein n=1 Tax=Artemia franciscana TaxID=6661 RepID=A0AA88IFP1_ARTSF|nr:hypothetical protein QYM36_008087 [Artemia franciscana]